MIHHSNQSLFVLFLSLVQTPSWVQPAFLWFDCRGQKKNKKQDNSHFPVCLTARLLSLSTNVYEQTAVYFLMFKTGLLQLPFLGVADISPCTTNWGLSLQCSAWAEKWYVHQSIYDSMHCHSISLSNKRLHLLVEAHTTVILHDPFLYIWFNCISRWLLTSFAGAAFSNKKRTQSVWRDGFCKYKHFCLPVKYFW